MNVFGEKLDNLYIRSPDVFTYQFCMWTELEWPPRGIAEGERETSCGSDIGDLMSACLSVCPSFTKIIKYLKQPLSLCSIYSLVQPHGDSMGPDATVHKDHFPIV
jgi:hypothetical protein